MGDLPSADELTSATADLAEARVALRLALARKRATLSVLSLAADLAMTASLGVPASAPVAIFARAALEHALAAQHPEG